MFSEFTVANLGIIFAAILFSMAIHEAMHAFVAHWLGDTTARDMGRLTLNPLKHVDLFTTVLLPVVLIAVSLPPFFIAKPVPFAPDRVKYEEFGAALIGAAGPLTNLGLAAIAAGLMRVSSIDVTSGLYSVFLIFIEVNIAFFVFNMIPFPPLDGSRVLYAFAPEWLQRVMAQIEAGGLMAIIIFMLVLYQFIAPIVGDISLGILRFLLA